MQVQVEETFQPEQNTAFEKDKAYEKLFEQLEDVQMQVDQLAEKDRRDEINLFKEVETVFPTLQKAKNKLKWNLHLHRQEKNLYVKNLVLKRRLILVKQKLIEVKLSRRKRKRCKLDILAEASTKVNLHQESPTQLLNFVCWLQSSEKVNFDEFGKNVASRLVRLFM